MCPSVIRKRGKVAKSRGKGYCALGTYSRFSGRIGFFALQMATTYSNTSLDTIDVDSLKSSRFLLPDKRLLPYRNAAGDVHLGLLEHSMKLIQSGTVQAPQAIVEDIQVAQALPPPFHGV